MLKIPAERSNVALKALRHATGIVESAIFLSQQEVRRNGRNPSINQVVQPCMRTW